MPTDPPKMAVNFYPIVNGTSQTLYISVRPGEKGPSVYTSNVPMAGLKELAPGDYMSVIGDDLRPRAPTPNAEIHLTFKAVHGLHLKTTHQTVTLMDNRGQKVKSPATIILAAGPTALMN